MTTATLLLPPELPPAVYIPPWVDPDTFVAPDREPLPDAMRQEPYFTDVMSTLRHHFRHRPDTLVSGDTHLYYDRNNLNRFYKPDCYVAFGVDVAALWQRNGYLTWLAGKPPDFALEIASESTWQIDMRVKRRDYARIGIGEYWRFDRSGGALYDAPLAGDRLVNGEYVPIEVDRQADGTYWGYSAALELWLVWDRGWLFFWDPKAGRFLRNLSAADGDRQAAEDALVTERFARQFAEDALETERTARQSAENALVVTQDALETAQDALESERATRQSTEDTLETERTARQSTEEALAASQDTLATAQDALETERAARESAEEIIRQLRAQLGAREP